MYCTPGSGFQGFQPTSCPAAACGQGIQQGPLDRTYVALGWVHQCSSTQPFYPRAQLAEDDHVGTMHNAEARTTPDIPHHMYQNTPHADTQLHGMGDGSVHGTVEGVSMEWWTAVSTSGCR